MTHTGNRAAWERNVTSRRTVILATGGVLAGVAACGSDDDGGTAVDTSPPESQAPDEPADGATDQSTGEPTGEPEPADTPTADETTEAPEGEVVGNVGDVPVGGGTVFADQEIVVVQPTEGDFRAYSAICTHQACPLESVANGEILCSQTCGHGSRYSAVDGTVTGGPAPAPLEEVDVSVDGDSIVAS